MARRYQVKPEEQQQSWVPRPLPTGKPCAVYARQSTMRQVLENKESAEAQTKEQVEKAQRLGWGTSEANKIHLFIENQQEDGSIRSASGTLRIDERQGLSALMELVYACAVSAIFVYNESRLFRDEWNIQVDTFVKACYDADVMVITQAYQYDFRRRPYDADQFRMQARIAADYIKSHVKGVLLPMRKRAVLRGEAVWGSVPVGYIIDRCKDNRTYRKLIPYEPHAEMVRYIFRRYRELGGRLYELGRELSQRPYVFPDFEGVAPPARFKPKKVKGGYTISRNGLVNLLTNVAYLGYWVVEGVVTSKRNHDPIVLDEGDFWYAFHRLSPVTIEGEEQERIGVPPARYNQITTIPANALLAEVITGEGEKRVYASAKHKIYRIYDNIDSFTRIKASIGIDRLDKAFSDRLIWRLKREEKAGNADTPDAMYARLREVQSEKVSQAVGVEQQIEQVEKRMAILRRNLNLDADEETLQGWAKELKQLAPIRAELEKKALSVEESKRAVEEYATLLERVKADWNSLTFTQKRRFINLVTERVILSEAAPHFFRIEIVWALPYEEIDVGYVFDELGNQEHWSKEEEAVLYEHYSSADRTVLLNLLPTRSWQSIHARAYRSRLSRPKHNLNTSTLPAKLSLRDKELLEREGINWNGRGCVWKEPVEREQVVDISPENSVTQAELSYKVSRCTNQRTLADVVQELRSILA